MQQVVVAQWGFHRALKELYSCKSACVVLVRHLRHPLAYEIEQSN